MKRSQLRARARQSRREDALTRPELRGESVERKAVGITSAPIKVLDPETQAALDRFQPSLEAFNAAFLKAFG